MAKCRYWDCLWQDWRIELKKGQILLDLLRYSEVLLKKTLESQHEVITLFLVGKKGRVTDINGVFTEPLIQALKLTKEIAVKLLRIREQVVGQQLWALAKLHSEDIARLSRFHIDKYCVEE